MKKLKLQAILVFVCLVVYGITILSIAIQRGSFLVGALGVSSIGAILSQLDIVRKLTDTKI